MQIQKSCTDTGGMYVYMRMCHGIELANMLLRIRISLFWEQGPYTRKRTNVKQVENVNIH